MVASWWHVQQPYSTTVMQKIRFSPEVARIQLIGKKYFEKSWVRILAILADFAWTFSTALVLQLQSWQLNFLVSVQCVSCLHAQVSPVLQSHPCIMEKVLQSSKHISVWQTSTMSTSAHFHASLRDRLYRHVMSFSQYSSFWYFTIVRRQISRALKCVYEVSQTTRAMVI